MAMVILMALMGCGDEDQGGAPTPNHLPVEEATIADLQAAQQAGRATARSLVDQYIARIETLDRSGPMLRAVVELNPDARSVAQALDGMVVVRTALRRCAGWLSSDHRSGGIRREGLRFEDFRGPERM
jgi:hypothetical protein